MGPVAFARMHRSAPIELRRTVGARNGPFGTERLREFDIEMCEACPAIAGRLLNPRLPEVRSTDGDPLDANEKGLADAKPLRSLVETKGIEPSTFALRTRRSPS
jgi:hypothetical protein